MMSVFLILLGHITNTVATMRPVEQGRDRTWANEPKHRRVIGGLAVALAVVLCCGGKGKAKETIFYELQPRQIDRQNTIRQLKCHYLPQ
jgi:hypothetical protein